MWANIQPVKLQPGVPCVPSATIGHGDDMDVAIQHGVNVDSAGGSGPYSDAGWDRLEL